MSLRPSILLLAPEPCSGLMYAGVPITMPVWVLPAGQEGLSGRLRRCGRGRGDVTRRRATPRPARDRPRAQRCPAGRPPPPFAAGARPERRLRRAGGGGRGAVGRRAVKVLLYG